MRRSYLLALASLALVSCAKTYIVPSTVVDERITRRQIRHNEQLSLISALTIPLLGATVTYVPDEEAGRPGVSDLKWLSAINKKGDTVEVEVKHSNTFIIKTTAGETVKMLAQTAFIEDGILKGKRSLLVGMAREVPLGEIAMIQMYTEIAKVRPYKK